jgi:hypothetical protein
MLRAGTAESQVSLQLPPEAVDQASHEDARDRTELSTGAPLICARLNCVGSKVVMDPVYKLYI